MNKTTRFLALCCALLLAVCMTAVAAADVDFERLAKLPETASYAKNADADAKYAPRVTTLDFKTDILSRNIGKEFMLSQ